MPRIYGDEQLACSKPSPNFDWSELTTAGSGGAQSFARLNKYTAAMVVLRVAQDPNLDQLKSEARCEELAAEFSRSHMRRWLHSELALHPAAQAALVALMHGPVEALRRELGRPLRVTSGYRSKRYNKAIGGSKGSFHISGEAVDLEPPRGMAAADVGAKLLLSGASFDQLCMYHPKHGGHVHISHRLGVPGRGDVLVKKGGKWHRYKGGKRGDLLLWATQLGMPNAWAGGGK